MDLDHLPTCPGAYLMKDAGGKVVYVGKANNLRSRVRSHFGHPQSDFVPLVERVEYIAAENEGEALLLEYQLIKKYKPRFHIRLRDDKNIPISNSLLARLIRGRFSPGLCARMEACTLDPIQTPARPGWCWKLSRKFFLTAAASINPAIFHCPAPALSMK